MLENAAAEDCVDALGGEEYKGEVEEAKVEGKEARTL